MRPLAAVFMEWLRRKMSGWGHGPVTRCFVVFLGLLAVTADTAAAQDAAEFSRDSFDRTVCRVGRGEGGEFAGKVGWGFGLRGAWAHQFAADVDGGGRYGVDRGVFSARISYSPKPRLPITLALGYRYDGYRFDGAGVFGAGPWGKVHSFRASIPFFMPLGERWYVIAVPTIRTTVEAGAPLEDGLSGGGFVGAGYRVNDRLSIGPGFGYLTEIEDDASFFPVVIVDWKITPRLTLKTGKGLGATQGPGLFLEWSPSSCWQLSLGGRYERNRFRLDDQGVAPRGVGEERQFAAVLAARFEPGEKFSVGASVGVSFLGRLRLEDRDGDRLFQEDTDPALFVGLGLGWKL